MAMPRIALDHSEDFGDWLEEVARANGRLDWLECCRHLPSRGLFPYLVRATHA